MMFPQVIAIVGPTAVGKSVTAVQVARVVGGEIVNADSRQVYRGMDIGTGTPAAEERAGVPHHLFDIVDPDKTFSLGLFLEHARCVIKDVHARGRIPIVVGGTGQYVWGLLDGWAVPEVAPDESLRAELRARAEAVGRQALHAELEAQDPDAAARIHPNNLTRTIRALEVVQSTGRLFSEQRAKHPPPWQVRIAGLTLDRPMLYRRIEQRIDSQIRAGWRAEVEALTSRGYGPDLTSFRSIGYREMAEHIGGGVEEDEMRRRIVRNTKRFARTQGGWFRAADPRIRWLDADSGEVAPRDLIRALELTPASPSL